MGIANEIARIQQAKADLKTSINAKGGTITNETIDQYASKVSALPEPKEEQQKTITPDFSSGNVVVTPTSGKVLSQVTINKDGNLVAENIKKDITVNGITGTLEGGGAEITGANEIDVIAQANINKGDTVRVTAGTTGIYVETTPTTLPTGDGRGCAFNHDGTRLAVAHYSSPYITIYDTTTTPYTKLSNPTTLPASYAYGCAFNHNGTRLAVAHYSSPYITAYGMVYGTPLAYKANNLLSGLAGRYGYAKENISLSAMGKVDVLFEA